MRNGALRAFLPALISVVILISLLAWPVQAFDGEPPTVQSTPVAEVAAPAFQTPVWVGVLLVFIVPFLYMLYHSRGKKMPDLQPPGAEVPVFDENHRPFRIYDDDEDEKQPGGKP